MPEGNCEICGLPVPYEKATVLYAGSVIGGDGAIVIGVVCTQRCLDLFKEERRRQAQREQDAARVTRCEENPRSGKHIFNASGVCVLCRLNLPATALHLLGVT